ncbi:MAG: 3-hydroxyacyl-ACP dehydratase FabZ [Nitrospirae bacterium]|nr:3-hydroxyacyl-ACP dehydratase FabZ [Nitrospirota bacterium]MBI3604438.1 3-hydroxyacyl-ACP dehydratase FabZ [Nitrospirota bacterium]
MLNILDIQKIIPHRYPFLLVDRIIEMELGEKIVGIKNVTFNEPFFQGHFPDYPIMPGVLIIEALAQVGGVLAFKSNPDIEGGRVYFLSIDKARFRKPVVPGDQVILQMDVLQVRAPYWKLMGKAYVKEELVCEAEIKAMISNKVI